MLQYSTYSKIKQMGENGHMSMAIESHDLEAIELHDLEAIESHDLEAIQSHDRSSKNGPMFTFAPVFWLMGWEFRADSGSKTH